MALTASSIFSTRGSNEAFSVATTWRDVLTESTRSRC